MIAEEIESLYILLGIGGGSLAVGLVLFGIALWKGNKLSPVMQVGALAIPGFAVLFGAWYLIWEQF